MVWESSGHITTYRRSGDTFTLVEVFFHCENGSEELKYSDLDLHAACVTSQESQARDAGDTGDTADPCDWKFEILQPAHD